MIKFNSEHILTGQIKEILSSFTLPQYRIFTKDNKDNKNLVPTTKSGEMVTKNYNPYIKNSTIQYYVKSGNTYNWEDTGEQYFVDDRLINSSRQLKIKNNLYDTYTHEYLGDYLRYKRDYLNIDLMPLYNCFSNNICSNIKIDKANIDSSNKTTKIYIVPIKLFKKYTIAIDCNLPVEMCCGIYDKYYNTKIDIAEKTYTKYNSLIFGQPVIYDGITKLTEAEILKVAPQEKNLKLIIKLPATNTSSITILEGDYRHFNDSRVYFTNNMLKRVQNYTETNFDTKINDFSDFSPVTPLQLLRFNTGTSYPFADRLIEYLTDNAITSEEEIIDNIRRVQKVIKLNTEFKTDGKKLIGNLAPKIDGLWEDSIRAIIYDQFNKKLKKNVNDVNHDILGYIDKDVEKVYEAPTGKFDDKNKSINITIANVDLYTNKDDLYSDLGEEDE